MIIGIDGNEANITNRVGVGQYAFHLLHQLHRLDSKNQYFIFLKDKPLQDMPPANKNWQYLVFGPKKLWSRIALPIYLFTKSPRLDLFFSPSHYSPSLCPCPTIPTIHDLGYLQSKEQFNKKDLYQLINWTKQSIQKAKHIVTVSQFSQEQIEEIYNVSPKKITIAYNGVDNPPKIDSKTQTKILSKYSLKADKYFLYLGTLKPNKNIPFLVRSFSLFCQKKPHLDIKLVIAGKKGWLFDEIFTTVQEEGIESKVIFTDFVNEEQKWTLYQQAICTVLPSTYEGFGIPAIESMKVGTPVIVSSIKPFKEVVQNNGIITDTKDKTQLCQKMIDILKPENQKKYSMLGKKQADKFTWESTAKSVLEAFSKIHI